MISSICDGTNPLTWAVYQLSRLWWVGMVVVAAVLAVVWVLYARNRTSWEVIAGGPRPGGESKSAQPGRRGEVMV